MTNTDALHAEALAANRTFDAAFGRLPIGTRIIHHNTLDDGPAVEATVVGRHFAVVRGSLLPMVELHRRRGPKFIPAAQAMLDTRSVLSDATHEQALTMNDTTLSPSDDFHAYSPHYDREHVESIAAHAEKNGTPYCRECHDWHHSDDDHS